MGLQGFCYVYGLGPTLMAVIMIGVLMLANGLFFPIRFACHSDCLPCHGGTYLFPRASCPWSFSLTHLLGKMEALLFCVYSCTLGSGRYYPIETFLRFYNAIHPFMPFQLYSSMHSAIRWQSADPLHRIYSLQVCLCLLSVLSICFAAGKQVSVKSILKKTLLAQFH